MKLIVLFALVAVAACEKDATIVKNLYESAVDNSFVTDIETSNGIFIKAYGESLPGPEPETGTSRQSGSYEYLSPEGQTIRVEWVADEFGYRATSDSIPEGADGQAAAAAPVAPQQDFQ